jgi:methionine biosynthesis protein MetW
MRLEHQIIIDLVEENSTVLDLGCGSGELLAELAEKKHVRGQGIEIDYKAVFDCVAKGLSVLHGDIDTGLPEYADQAFDYVILNQSLQQVKKPVDVLNEAFRVGKKVIVGIPNFAHIKARVRLGFLGRVPVTKALPYEWFDTPNLHFLSLLDFRDYCRLNKIQIEETRYIGQTKEVKIFPNLFAHIGAFLLAKGK